MVYMQNQFPTTSRYHSQANRYPDEFIQSFSSFPFYRTTSSALPNRIGMASARFSPSPGQEHILALGSEDGMIDICDVKKLSKGYKIVSSTIATLDKNAIFDFCFIPSDSNKLIFLSGNTIFLWNFEQLTYASFIGHTKSVRCASVWHENLSLLVTGAKDGQILGWDLRAASPPRSDSSSNAVNISDPSRKYSDAHPTMSDPASITSLLHYGENYIISGSSSASSGIRIWDLRYAACAKPLRTLVLPQQEGENKKTDWGVSSLCWDRHYSSLFAACTDNTIHEYVPILNSDMPVKTLAGQNIDSFLVQCVASPISDHLLCGSADKSAYIWDLQEDRKYRQDDHLMRSDSQAKFLPNPKFSLDGHEEQVETVQWSSHGNYMLTLGQNLRIWHKWTERGEHGYPAIMRIDDFPTQLTYPTLLEKWATCSVHPPNRWQNHIGTSSTTLQKSPLRILENLPALHIKNRGIGMDAFIRMKSPKRLLVIKGNTFMTPAAKISKVDSTENLCGSGTRRTPRRNLNAEFQRSQKTPGSGGSKRKGRLTPTGSGKRPKASGRSLHLNNKSPTPGSSTTPTLEQFFSPSTSKEKRA